MMTNSWAEVHPSPAAYADWLLLEQSKAAAGQWTPQENKLFEDALALYDKDTPDRWERVAEMTGKTVRDVYSHYEVLEEDVRIIEEGLVSFPGYDSPFTLDWESCQGGYEGLKQAYCPGGKRSAAVAARPDHERKKGVPWTEEEHRLFLMGLKKYGKGDWRNISRNFVVSRTPTQVASHAQKYYIRLNSGSKDKRRSSIHDITTVNLPDRSPLPSQQSAQSNSSTATHGGLSDQFSAVVDSNQHSEAASVYSPSAAHSISNQLMQQQPYGMDSYRMKLQSHNLHRGAVHNSMVARHGMMFQMQTVQPHPHG